MTALKIDRTKLLDVVAVGSWTNFDHLFQVDRLPMPGDTVQITSPIALIEKTYWGGCAPNNAAAAAKLGAKVGLISVVGDDFTSRGYYGYLASLGVDLSGLIIVRGDHSGHSFLFANPHGDAICISHIGASEKQETFEPDARVLSSGKVVIINYRFDKFTKVAAELAHDAGSFVIASGNLATSTQYAEDILRSTDMLICTKHELQQLLWQLGKDSLQQHLFDMGIQAVIETHGVDGSVIITQEARSEIPAVLSKNVIDPVGAGDGFVGGVATGLAFGYSLEDAVRLGAAVASFVVEAVGCQTNQPSWDQALQRLNEHGISISKPS